MADFLSMRSPPYKWREAGYREKPVLTEMADWFLRMAIPVEGSSRAEAEGVSIGQLTMGVYNFAKLRVDKDESLWVSVGDSNHAAAIGFVRLVVRMLGGVPSDVETRREQPPGQSVRHSVYIRDRLAVPHEEVQLAPAQLMLAWRLWRASQP